MLPPRRMPISVASVSTAHVRTHARTHRTMAPMSSAVMSRSSCSVMPWRPSSLLSTSGFTTRNWRSGESVHHMVLSTAVVRRKKRAADTGHALRSAISNRARATRPAFLATYLVSAKQNQEKSTQTHKHTRTHARAHTHARARPPPPPPPPPPDRYNTKGVEGWYLALLVRRER